MNEEDLLLKLEQFNYPTEENGWIKRNQNGLPSYKQLRKTLLNNGIKPSVTWDKEECIKESGSLPLQNDINFEDKSTNIFYSSILKLLQNERKMITEIKTLIPNFQDKLNDFIKEKENNILKKQNNIIKKKKQFFLFI